MKQKSYYQKREIECMDKLDAIVAELPYYCEDFFVGIENRTSALTRLNYGYDLRIFFDYLSKRVFRGKPVKDITFSDLDILTATDIEYFISYLGHYTINGKNERCSESGKARKLSTIRAFFKFFFNKDRLSANIASKVMMPKIHEKEIIRLDSDGKKDEVEDMIYTVQTGNGLTKRQLAYHNETKLRDTAIVTLFLGTGIRISELIGLDVNDVDLSSNSFVVTRKGGNRAVLYFNDEVNSALSSYIAQRNNDDKVKKSETALFISLQNKRISTRTVQELVKKYAKTVNPLKKITPHKLRSTFGTNLYKATGDIYAVADCLGHKDVNTTKKHYAAITDDIRKNAVRSVKLTKHDDYE